MKKVDIDSKVYELYDEYCHSNMGRREFLKRAGALTVLGSVSGLTMAKALLPDYAAGPDNILHGQTDQTNLCRI